MQFFAWRFAEIPVDVLKVPQLVVLTDPEPAAKPNETSVQDVVQAIPARSPSVASSRPLYRSNHQYLIRSYYVINNYSAQHTHSDLIALTVSCLVCRVSSGLVV